MALRGVRRVQVVRRAVCGWGRAGGGGRGRAGRARPRLAPPDAARPGRTQGVLALAVHAVCQVSTQPSATPLHSGAVTDAAVSTSTNLQYTPY